MVKTEEMVFFGVNMWPFKSHFWGKVPDISHKNKDARETVVFWVYVWPFWGSDGAPYGRER